MSKRSMVAAILDRVGVFSALLGARSHLPGSSSVPVLVCHCVAKPSKGYAFDDGVLDASPAQLDEQMEVVARYFTPIGIDDLLAMRVPLDVTVTLPLFRGVLAFPNLARKL